MQSQKQWDCICLEFFSRFFPKLSNGKTVGKKWFEQEVAYQVYPDGTYLQFSMNYHRVVIQLLTWGLRLSQLNNETLDTVVKDRAPASVISFLMV